MKYETATAFRIALEARLRDQATQGHASLVRLRKHVVFDRLLARLLVVQPDRWVIKGGLALDYRYGAKARTTVDLDLAMMQGRQRISEILAAASQAHLGDMFAFSVRSASELRITEGTTARYRVLAKLDDRKFEEVAVDVGFDDRNVVESDILRGPALLEFAGLPPVEVPAISLNLHIAEKLHAYTQTFQDGRPNTRVKDLIDLNLISSFSEFRVVGLRAAIDEVFGDRSAQIVPLRLPPPPTLWDASYPRLAVDVGLDPDLAVGYARAAAFLNPVLCGKVGDAATWDPSSWSWR